MKKIDLLKKIYGLVDNPKPECLEMSLADTHHEGIFSLVLDGNEFGKLTRVFIAKTKLKPFEVQLHTHRYPIRLTIIKGIVKHYVAYPTQVSDSHTVELSEFEYKSPLNGGNGMKYTKESMFVIKDYSLPIGATIEMTEDEYHTMSCSSGSIWVVEEMGFKKDSSNVLGVPFVIDGLYNKPKPFQVTDACQVLKKELKVLINSYEAI